jgi:7-cyano-7-deazaguanine synthase
VRAVVLLSGGLDSTTAAAWARRVGHELHALSIDYGQRHAIELERAARVASALGCASHRVVKIDLRAIGGSALTADLAVPKDRSEAELGAGVPITYVPARNAVFLSCALGLAEVVGAPHLVIGVNVLDSSGYPDCRPAFVRAFEELANQATAAATERGVRFRVLAPLVDLTKAGIVKLALELGAPLELTWSCYDPVRGELACGHCDACQLRLKGFREAGSRDPIRYAD